MGNDKIKLNYGEGLVIDPCYVKYVTDGIGLRFDALKTEKVLFEGDDGEYEVIDPDGVPHWLGVDSGRIWILKAEFDCEVEVSVPEDYYIHLDKMDDFTQVMLLEPEDEEGDE